MGKDTTLGELRFQLATDFGCDYDAVRVSSIHSTTLLPMPLRGDDGFLRLDLQVNSDIDQRYRRRNQHQRRLDCRYTLMTTHVGLFNNSSNFS